VLVGAGAKQRRFTVHHDLITKRSKFFRAARSERWTLIKSKPADLQHCDPDIFAKYLHCIYRDAVPFYDMFYDDGDTVETNATYTMDVIRTDSWTGRRTGRVSSTHGTKRSLIYTFSPIGCSTLPRQTWRSMGSDALA
jgi:hypothetical protein